MINELIVVTPTKFRGTNTPDKNGKETIMFQIVAGKCPNRNVVAGTVAEMNGFELEKTYLAQVREVGTDSVFGRQFTFLRLNEMDPLQVIKARKELGEPELIIIPKAEGFDQTYERKSDAVESLNTKRERDGLFVKAVSSNSTHETAKTVVEGSTLKDASDQQRNLTPEDLKKNIPKEKEKENSSNLNS